VPLDRSEKAIAKAKRMEESSSGRADGGFEVLIDIKHRNALAAVEMVG